MGTRIRVIGGPWPERVGCIGRIVPDPGNGIYPFDKPDPSHRVVKLVNDPLTSSARSWTCVMRTRDIEFLPE